MNFTGTKNFRISELEASSTARKYKIDNRIPSEYLSNAKRLLEFLQDLKINEDLALSLHLDLEV